MNLELTNKVILITGGATGIGAGITRAFAKEGAVACILGRNPKEACEIIAEQAAKGNRVESYSIEMTHEATIQKAIEEIVAVHGRIDAVINNAGGNDAIGLRHQTEDFRQSLEKNIVSCFSLVHHAIDHLIASRGVIINIGSKCAVTGQGGTSGYAASKGRDERAHARVGVGFGPIRDSRELCHPCRSHHATLRALAGAGSRSRHGPRATQPNHPLGKTHNNRGGNRRLRGFPYISEILAHHRTAHLCGRRIRSPRPCLHTVYVPFEILLTLHMKFFIKVLFAINDTSCAPLLTLPKGGDESFTSYQNPPAS